jgi:hypothetical protein
MDNEEKLRKALLNDEFPDAEEFYEKQAFSVAPENRLKFERNAAVAAWMTGASGREVLPTGADWQANKDALAQGFFKIPTAKDITDESIHDLIRSHIQTSDNTTNLALESALSGRPLPQALGELHALTGVSKTRGIRDRYLNEASSIYGNIAAKVAPYRSIVNEAAGMLSGTMKVNEQPLGEMTDAFNAVAEKLVGIPEQDRRLVIEAIAATGGTTAEERSSYLSKMGARVNRIAETMGAAVASNAFTFGKVLEAFPSGLANKPEEVAGIMAEELKGRELTLLAQQIRTAAAEKLDPVKGNSWLQNQGLAAAEMATQSSIAIASPIAAFGANLAYFRDTIGADVMTQNPGMTVEQSDKVSAVAAPVNAAIETVTALIPWGKVKLPVLQKWLMTETASIGGAARNLGIRAATGTTAEIGEEWLQAYAPLKAQQLMGALGQDMPSVDWEKNMPKFADIAAEVWAPALLFSLVGGGVASINDIKNGRSLAADLDMLVAKGIAPELATKIKEASDAGDYRKADSLFRAEFVSDTKASKPDIQAATERLKARFKAQENIEALTETTSPDYTASVTRTPTGWQVTTGEGTIIPTDTAEGANRIYNELRQVGSQQEANVISEVLDTYFESGMGRGAMVEMTGEDVEANRGGVFAIRRDANNVEVSQRPFGPQALETVRKEAEVAGIKAGAGGVIGRINGSNELFGFRVADTAKAVWRKLSLFKSSKEGNPQIFTLLHEDIESKFREGLRDETWTEEDARTAFRALVPAFANTVSPVKSAEEVSAMSDSQRRKYESELEDRKLEYKWIENVRELAEGKGNYTMLQETFSEMYVRDRFAKDRRGKDTGLKPMQISRALEAAVVGANTNEEASALVRIIAMFRAFSAHMKAVFSTVKAMVKARDNGTIGEDWDAFVNKVVGIDEVKQMEGQAIDEAKAIMEAGKMPFSISPVNWLSESYVDYEKKTGATYASEVKKTRSNLGEITKTKTVFHETGISGARQLLSAIMGRNMKSRFYVTNDRDLALGQGGKGVLIELDSSLVNGIKPKSMQNQTLSGAGSNSGEFVIEKVLANAVTSITGAAKNLDKLIKDVPLLSKFQRVTDDKIQRVEGPSFSVSIPTSDIDTIPEDLARAEADMKAGGKDWASKVDLSQPVGVYRGEDGRLKLFDGHHRWLAARERGEPLQVREGVMNGPTFSISPIRNLNELSDQVERQFAENPVGALEVKSKMIRQFAKYADKWSNERWTPQGNKIRPISEKRTVKSLDKEQAMRQAQREVELVNEGMDKLTPETLMAWSEGMDALDDHPLIQEMLGKHGKLMSLKTAQKEGRDIKDQYDDAPWIPPQWYAKSGGIMPDVMADNLKFGYAKDMWAEIESIIKTYRDKKEGYAKAEAAVKAVEKAAFEQARQEAQAWRDETDAMQKEDWSPKESLVRDLITLEAIVAMFPQEIRGKIGGFVALARKASESARLKVLQKQLERGQVLLEKHLKDQYGEATDKLLKRYQSQKDASGRITGKIISTATEQVDYAAEFIKLSVEDQADREAALEKKIETSDTAEEVQDALTKLGIARLFEVWDTKDSAARESAFNWLADTIEQGKLGKKILDEERKAFLTDMRQSAQSSILQGDKLSPGVADNITNLDKKVMKRALLGMRGVLSSSLWTTLQRLELIFGEDSKTLNYFAERIINAANLSTDIKRLVEAQKKEALSIIFNSDSKYAHARGIAELQKVKQSGITTRKVTKEEIKLDLETLTKLNDGTMTADAAGLRQDEVDAALEEFANNGRKSTVTVERVTDAGTPVKRMMSETQGIGWWMWSMQDASRKQMELDGWDEDSFKQLEEFLSPEAKALARWMANSYSVDAPSLIDPVYRKLLNAPLPRTKNYSPMIRRNINTGGDVMDMEASDMNSGLAASFVKARVNSTAPLVETDALALFLAHWENVAHWVSHAELMRDMKAVLLDKDTAVAIRQKKSEGYLQRLKEDVKTIESNGTSTARELVDISRMWRWFMQFRAYKGLAFRISPIIKQTPAMLNPLLADVPAHNYMMGMARAFMEPKAFASEVSAMWSSDIIRRRIESGFSAESRVAMQGTSMTGSQAILAMQTGMMPMQMVDGGWTALGAAISFDYYRRGYMRDNPQMTPEIADSKAIARVEKMIATSAQPSDIYARALFERSGNPFMRSMSMFVSDQRKTLAIELMAIRRLATGKSKNKALDIQRAIVAHVVMASVSQVMAGVIASLLGDDEDRDREWSVEQWTLALALGPVNGLFVFGRLIDKIGRGLLGLRIFPNDDLASKAASDLLRGGKNMDELFNPDDPDEFMDALDTASTALGAGLSAAIGPVGGAVDVGANVVREARKVQKRLSD